MVVLHKVDGKLAVLWVDCTKSVGAAHHLLSAEIFGASDRQRLTVFLEQQLHVVIRMGKLCANQVWAIKMHPD